MRVTLTDEQHYVLAAARLIELSESRWTVTRRGEAMLEPRGYLVH